MNRINWIGRGRRPVLIRPMLQPRLLALSKRPDDLQCQAHFEVLGVWIAEDEPLLHAAIAGVSIRQIPPGPARLGDDPPGDPHPRREIVVDREDVLLLVLDMLEERR